MLGSYVTLGDGLSVEKEIRHCVIDFKTVALESQSVCDKQSKRKTL